MKTVTNEIEVEAPVQRVWKAVSDSREFGNWLGAVIDGEFKPGVKVNGKMLVSEMTELEWDIEVEAMLENELMVFTWPPYQGEPNPELRNGPRIRVEIHLRPTENGTVVTISETGFSALREGLCEQVYENHQQGWSYMIVSFADYIRENPQPPPFVR